MELLMWENTERKKQTLQSWKWHKHTLMNHWRTVHLNEPVLSILVNCQLHCKEIWCFLFCFCGALSWVAAENQSLSKSFGGVTSLQDWNRIPQIYIWRWVFYGPLWFNSSLFHPTANFASHCKEVKGHAYFKYNLVQHICKWVNNSPSAGFFFYKHNACSLFHRSLHHLASSNQCDALSQLLIQIYLLKCLMALTEWKKRDHSIWSLYDLCIRRRIGYFKLT